MRVTPHAGQRPAGRDRMVIQLARGHRVSVPAAVELSRQGKTLRVGAEHTSPRASDVSLAAKMEPRCWPGLRIRLALALSAALTTLAALSGVLLGTLSAALLATLPGLLLLGFCWPPPC